MLDFFIASDAGKAMVGNSRAAKGGPWGPRLGIQLDLIRRPRALLAVQWRMLCWKMSWPTVFL